MTNKRKAEIRKSRREFLLELVTTKNRAGELGLWKTMHALDKGTQAVGWEMAEIYAAGPEKEFRGLT